MKTIFIQFDAYTCDCPLARAGGSAGSMNFYAHEFSLFDFPLPPDQAIDSLCRSSSFLSSSFASDHVPGPSSSPPKRRHDGKSPLPLGMDWIPPGKLDARYSSCHPDYHPSSWGFHVTIPSWKVLPESLVSPPLVLYNVHVIVRSPEGVTISRSVFRRFNDFLKLFSNIKDAFPGKDLPSTPSKGILRMKTKMLLEERRISLEAWMRKLLSDIDISRSAPVAFFLELEATARSSLSDVHVESSDASSSDLNMATSGSSIPLNISIAHQRMDVKDTALPDGSHRSNTCAFCGCNMKGWNYAAIEGGQEINLLKSNERSGLGMSRDEYFSISEGIEAPEYVDGLIKLGLEFPLELIVALPPDGQHKMNRFVSSVVHKMDEAKTDVEDCLARLDQETTLSQYLTTKVKELEMELETMKVNCKDKLEQAFLVGQEKQTQMQWDMEELKRKHSEIEQKLNLQKEEKLSMESMNASILAKNESLINDLDIARDELARLQKQHEEFEIKSKGDTKVLVKEIKSLRSSNLKLKHEFDGVMRQKLDVEKILDSEKKRKAIVDAINTKLYSECDILRSRLRECSVSFLIAEEDKLVVDAASPSDALDLLATSDNRIGLLLAEAQLLAQDVENAVLGRGSERSTIDAEYQLRKLVTDMFIENATAIQQVNSAIRSALSPPRDLESVVEGETTQTTHRETVLSKFLEF